MIKYGSRKFIALCVGVALGIFIPILYKEFGIGEGVMLAVLGMLGSSLSIYIGFNVWEKKKLGNP